MPPAKGAKFIQFKVSGEVVRADAWSLKHLCVHEISAQPKLKPAAGSTLVRAAAGAVAPKWLELYVDDDNTGSSHVLSGYLIGIKERGADAECSGAVFLFEDSQSALLKADVAAVMDSTQDAVLVLNKNMEVLQANSNAARLLGLDGAALAGVALSSLLVPTDAARLRAAARAVQQFDRWDDVFCFKTAPEAPWRMTLKKSGNGTTLAAVIQPQVARPTPVGAEHDPLTGLLHRWAGLQRMQALLDLCVRRQEVVLGIMLRLQGLAELNAQIGHDAVDRCITTIVHAAFGLKRSSDVAFRYDGSSFVLVMPGVRPDSCAKIVQRVRQRASQALRQLGDDRWAVDIGAQCCQAAQSTATQLIDALLSELQPVLQ